MPIGKHFNSTISRRHILKLCGVSAGVEASASRQKLFAGGGKFSFKIAKEIKGAFCRAVSPDSRRICICSYGVHQSSYRLFSGGLDKRSVSYAGPYDFLLKVLEVGSWQEIYTGRFQGSVGAVSFFQDGGTLLVQSSIVKLPIKNLMFLVDLSTGHTDKQEELYKAETAASYSALSGTMLFGATHDRGLVKVAWPDLRNEFLRVPAWTGGSLIAMTSDRRMLVHLGEQSLVCRRMDDLSIIWTRQVDPRIDLKEKWDNNPLSPHIASAAFAISATGNRVALAPWGAAYKGRPERFYLEILNGSDGTPIVRWALRPQDMIALSPDGKLLAIGEVVDDHSGNLRPTVNLYEIPSPEIVATVVHDQVPNRRRLGASLSAGIEFTPDGRYLITSSTHNIKVWERG